MARETSYTLVDHRVGTQMVGPDNTRKGTIVSRWGTSLFIIPAASRREIFRPTWGQRMRMAQSILRSAGRDQVGAITRDCVSVLPKLNQSVSLCFRGVWQSIPKLFPIFVPSWCGM